MQSSFFDISVFLCFIGVVVAFSMFKSRREKTSEDYFLASRGLKWWLIGFSIVAANISTEQFVGMAGQGAGSVGLAVSGYQLLGAITIVFVAIFFLPRFLRAGIYTMPEYLEYRYNTTARGIMAFYMMVVYVAVTITAVLYSGGLTLHTIFDMNLTAGIFLIGAVAALYTTWGGLKAVAWADLFQGSGLIIGGIITMVLGFIAIGGLGQASETDSGVIATFLSGIKLFGEKNADRLHMVLPADHAEIPWTALVVGLWIPNFYYCGLNQFIVQRTLAAKTLRQGQLGIIFAASLWLIVPFAIVLPGIMAVQLYGDQLTSADQAYPMLIRNLIPAGLKGFIFAALSGAVISSIASMLNSASTIFTMDLYKRYWHKDASQRTLVRMGRIVTVLFVVIGCLIAPHLGDPRLKGVFHYIQEFQGYISPGILAAFVFGFIFKRAPALAGVTALLLNVPLYGFLQWQYGEKVAFLNRMAITFGVIVLVMSLIACVKPLPEPKVMPVKEDLDMSSSPLVLWLGGAVIVGVIVFYIIFW
ncbi:MAG: solute:sodium symporter family transporter [Planctomycetota bacterium]|jgi:SSS family solute:Na+ symporter